MSVLLGVSTDYLRNVVLADSKTLVFTRNHDNHACQIPRTIE